MPNTALHVENLGKRYFIGAKQERYRTFRDALADAARSAVRGPWSVVSGPPSQVPGPVVPGPWSIVPGPWSPVQGL